MISMIISSTMKSCADLPFLAAGAILHFTHPDTNCPSQRGSLPDAGSFIALIEKSTGRLPDVICGKPNAVMAQAVEEKFELESRQIAMVGDRLTTDMAFAINNGFASILVLTGETDRKLLNESGIKPDYVFDSVRDIIGEI